MFKFIHLWSILLCSIRIKDTTLVCRWPILGHHTLLLLHLSMPMLGHPIPHLEFIMVRILIRQLILAWGTLLECSNQWLFLRFFPRCKYLWCLCHATRIHMVSHPIVNILLGLKLWKVNKLCQVTIKGRGRLDGLIESILNMIRSLWHMLSCYLILYNKGPLYQKKHHQLFILMGRSTILTILVRFTSAI